MANGNTMNFQSINDMLDRAIILCIEQDVIYLNHHNDIMTNKKTWVSRRLPQTKFFGLQTVFEVGEEILWGLPETIN